MNIKKVAMMLTIMLITILSASSFYVLTGEAELNQNIIVISKQTEDGVIKEKDYEKVYGEGPYTEKSGLHKNESYYIRYTGAESGRTVVDLEDTNVTDKNGKTVDSGLTIDKDGNVVIMETKITSTYKMFSYRKGTEATNTEITRVFVPSSIAFPTKNNGVPTQEGADEGIASNTFSGYESSTVEKDVIYHTGNVLTNNSTKDARGAGITDAYDRTTKISKDKYSHITTYVYLGSENISSRKLVRDQYEYAYSGKVKNVFVSNSVDYPCALFDAEPSVSDVTLIKYVLLDDGKTWFQSNMGLANMFCVQRDLQLTSNFKLPSEIYQCSSENTGYINNNGLRLMFYLCTSLGNLPPNFTIPSGITNIAGMFAGCENLKGIINLSDANNISIVNAGTSSFFTAGERLFLRSAGTSASNYENCNTPIIVKYPVTNALLDNYTDNIYTPQTTSGKVTMLPVTSDSDTVNNNWERVKVNDGETAPYYDENGGYYIRYKGNYKTVYMDTIERTDDDKLGHDIKDLGIIFSSGTKNPCILNTKLCSTYKMFSYREGGTNTEITRVFIPSAIAINGDKGLSSNTDSYNNNGIASNTFEGWNTDTEKDVIYHTGNVLTKDSTKDARGEGITDACVRTTKISKDDDAYPHVTIYGYLGSENVTRGPNTLTADVVTYTYYYKGNVKNVFVSNSVKYPANFFSVYNNYATPLDYVLLDNGETWVRDKMGIAVMFYGQTNLQITNNFKLPNKIYQGNNSIPEFHNGFGLFVLFYGCKSITDLPPNFEISSDITDIAGMFHDCPRLRGIIRVSGNSKILSLYNYHFLYNVGTDPTLKPIDGFKTPVVVAVDQNTSLYSSIQSYINAGIINSNYVTLVDINKLGTQTLSENDNPIAVAEEATNKIVIEDCTEEISVKVNEISNQKLTVEDETDFVSVTVNKNSDENKSEEDEVQD